MNINYPQIPGEVKLQQGPFRYSMVKMTDLVKDDYTIWNGQRILNEDHVARLTRSFLRSINRTTSIKYCSSVPHIVVTKDGKKHIIDGQHRMRAFQSICDKYNNAFDVLVLYEQCDTEKDIKRAFKRSNTVWAQRDGKIKEIFTSDSEDEDNDNIEISDEDIEEENNEFKKKLIGKLWNAKMKDYGGLKGMMKATTKPQKPHLNANTMLDKLENALERNSLNFNSYQELEKIYNNANESIKKSALCLKFKEKSPDKWIKCEKYDCFIGIVKDFTIYMTNKVDPTVVVEKLRYEPPPPAVRKALWQKYFGTNTQGKCWCCEIEDISVWAFHAGHIESDKDGGLPTVENLVPLCPGCNTSMGSMNAHKYKEQHFKKL